MSKMTLTKRQIAMLITGTVWSLLGAFTHIEPLITAGLLVIAWALYGEPTK